MGFAVWVRPALGVFQPVDEVTDVVAAAEVGEDCGEAIHGGSTKRRAWCVCVCVYAREVVEVVEE